MPAGTVRRHSFIHRFSQGEGGISRSAHNLAGPGALGTTAHFEASNNSSAIANGMVRRRNLCSREV